MKNGRKVMWIAVVSVAMAAGNAQGITIGLDPGALGTLNQSQSIQIQFGDLNGTDLTNQAFDLDFVMG